MLTLFYVSATFLQSWRIKSVCCKIAEQLAQEASIAFYVLPASNKDGFDPALATSELCSNRKSAKVTEILWLLGNQRGCCIRPIQSLLIKPWISFVETSNWIPFAYKQNEKITQYLASRKDLLHLLLEADIQLHPKDDPNVDVVQIEDYGKLIAWKIDSHLAVIIETDVENFTKLLVSTFLQNNFLINDQLLLLRIESVSFEGKPQPIGLLSGHLRKPTRTTTEPLNELDWQKHLDDLRSLSVLANQATEFEYNKNRTEGKTGIIKPDLIPPEKLTNKEEIKVETRLSAIAASINAETCNTKEFDADELTSKEYLSNLLKEETLAPSSSNSPPVKLDNMKAKTSEIQTPKATSNTDKIAETPVNTTSQVASSSPTLPTYLNSKTRAAASELEKIAAALALTPKKTSNLPNIEQTSNLKEQNIAMTTSSLNTTPITDNQNLKILNEPVSSVQSANLLKKETPRRLSLRRHKNNLKETKPLNVLVYADSSTARESALVTLKDILEKDLYTIYAMSAQQVEQKFWIDNTALLVVCGTVAMNIGEIFVDYFVHGGKVLSLCSDILHFILPTYRTAEVREHELVQFSYDKWQKVKMMHHIFCYQPSPVKKNFSTDSDDSAMQNTKKPALVCPRFIELKDLYGEVHNLDVKVLGTEETWNTPSLLLANSVKSGGKAVFSQVHLETNPNQFEADEQKFSILKQTNTFVWKYLLIYLAVT